MQDYHKLCCMMMRAMRMHRRIIEGRIQSLGIHPSQHFLLMQLSREGNIPSQARIAEMMDVSPASVARTLKNLDEGGYILRMGGETDSRRNEIAITEKGESVVDESRRLFMNVDNAVYADFTEEETLQLERLLHKMIGNLAALEQEEKEMKQA